MVVELVNGILLLDNELKKNAKKQKQKSVRESEKEREREREGK